MKSRIQKSLSFILCITLICTFVLFVGVVYRENLRVMRAEVKQEALYISTALNNGEKNYLVEVAEFVEDSRITVIDGTGVVLYDSVEKAEAMANHFDREEVQQAIRSGSGTALRVSDTIGMQTFYHAVLLESGDILRVSKTTDTALGTILQLLPMIVFIGILMFVLALLLAHWQTKRLIKPINELDIEHPLENQVYEELRPLLESMERSNKTKEQAAQSRKEFSANVSHELKTPLTSISGYAELMKNNMVRPQDMERFSEKIYTEASRLIVLVEDIIKLSRLDEGRVDVEKEEVDLFYLVREIGSRLSLQAENKKIKIEIMGESVKYRGIKPVLDEMIYNIFENAIKYNVQGGKIDIWTGNTLSGPKIIIRDTGIGIPKEEQERVFERFYRVDKSHSKETGGTGLGLSIVKHGAELHKALIHIESEEGVGTKMEINFPVK